jgi:hypothetical protein
MGVVVTEEELISQIQKDHKNRRLEFRGKRMVVEELFPYNSYTIGDNVGQSTTTINGIFIYFQLLIDCLMRLESNKNDTQELIELCREKYKDSKSELDRIYEFKQKYSADKAL